MDLKRFTRGPLLWILGIVVLLLLVTTMFNSDGNFEKTDTSKVVSLIQEHKVANAKVIDKDQRIEVTTTDGKRYYSSWIEGQGVQLTNALQQANPRDGWTADVPKENFLVSLLVSFLPFVILVLIFLFIMNQMQGGGSRSCSSRSCSSS